MESKFIGEIFRHFAEFHFLIKNLLKP